MLKSKGGQQGSGRRSQPKPRGKPAASTASRAKGLVSFQGKVQVREFSRHVGGGVPSDTGVALGLGIQLRKVTEPLSTERPGVGKLDKAAEPLPPRQRAQLLRQALGQAEYSKAQRIHGKELLTLQTRREQNNQTDQDFEPMPESLKQARLRAKKLEQEVAKNNPFISTPKSKAVAKSPKPRPKAKAGRSAMKSVRKVVAKAKWGVSSAVAESPSEVESRSGVQAESAGWASQEVMDGWTDRFPHGLAARNIRVACGKDL